MEEYYDIVSNRRVHRLGLRETDCGFPGDMRPNELIVNGMLLRSQVHMARFRRIGLTHLGTYPDLAAKHVYAKCPDPPLDEDSLWKYFRGFAETVIPLLDLEPESVAYIRENLGRVMEHLVPKLRKGHLKFYKAAGGGKIPDDGAALLFLDTSDPESPAFLFPVFGLKKTTFEGRGYFRWRPCPNESQEPEPKRFKWDKTMESLTTGWP